MTHRSLESLRHKTVQLALDVLSASIDADAPTLAGLHLRLRQAQLYAQGREAKNGRKP